MLFRGWLKRIPAKLRLAFIFLLGAIAQWVIGETLNRIKPSLPAAGSKAVSVIQDAIGAIEPLWFLLLAVGAAAPFLWEKLRVRLSASCSPDGHLRLVENQAFSHATVRLDGKKFVNCQFSDVTFRWDGGEFSMSGTMAGFTRFETKNPTVRCTVDVLKALQLLGGPGGTEFAADWRPLPNEYFNVVDNE